MASNAAACQNTILKDQGLQGGNNGKTYSNGVDSANACCIAVGTLKSNEMAIYKEPTATASGKCTVWEDATIVASTGKSVITAHASSCKDISSMQVVGGAIIKNLTASSALQCCEKLQLSDGQYGLFNATKMKEGMAPCVGTIGGTLSMQSQGKTTLHPPTPAPSRQVNGCNVIDNAILQGKNVKSVAVTGSKDEQIKACAGHVINQGAAYTWKVGGDGKIRGGYVKNGTCHLMDSDLYGGADTASTLITPLPGTPTPPAPATCTEAACKTSCPPGSICIGNDGGSAPNVRYEGFFFIDKYTSSTGKVLQVQAGSTSQHIAVAVGQLSDPSHGTQACGGCPDVKYTRGEGGDPDTVYLYGATPQKSYTLESPLCLASTTKIPKIVNSNIQYVEVKDLKDGDMIRTTRGDFPLSHIMYTTTVGPHTYVKVEQGSLGNNLPSQDLYLTHEHSFSLGYYKNSVLNRNIHDPAQDDMVYLHITADQLADKLPGITRVQKEFDSMFNLVFDEHVSLDIYGLEVMMHHPKGNPYTLPEEKYQDKTKFNNKVQKPLFAHYGMLENVKPNHMEMKDFLRNCITANLEDKFRLEDVNHPSFIPPKTILSEDMREKLHVA